jgi:subtilisin family serine protease
MIDLSDTQNCRGRQPCAVATSSQPTEVTQVRHAYPSRSIGSAIENLEPRRLLSGLASNGAPAIAAITWQGQRVNACEGQWVSQFNAVTGTPAEQVKLLRDRLAAAEVPATVLRHLGSDGLVLLQAAAEVDCASLTVLLAAVPDFRFAEPNFAGAYVPEASAVESVVPDDPLFGQQWALHNTGQTVAGETGIPDADIDMPEAWDLITGGIGRSENSLPDHSRGRSEIVVGVIDSGVDYTHPDLARNMWQNLPELNGQAGVDDDGNGYVDDVHGYDFVGAGDADPMDDNGHGTLVAGVIGASGDDGVGVADINRGVKIMALKFLDANNFGAESDMLEAINYSTLMRKRGVNLRLTNNSYGAPVRSEALRQAIAANAETGMLFVAAAGNFGVSNDVAPAYPASFDLPNIISVANTNNRDLKLPSANWGAATVDLGAPGRVILSTLPGGGYAFVSGSSFAAPHVAGVASLAWGLQPGSRYEQIRDAIFAGVDKIPALQGATPTVTGGRLNAYNTLKIMLHGRSNWAPHSLARDAESDVIGVAALAGIAGDTKDALVL